jgi:hypothetical protein
VVSLSQGSVGKGLETTVVLPPPEDPSGAIISLSLSQTDEQD